MIASLERKLYVIDKERIIILSTGPYRRCLVADTTERTAVDEYRRLR